MTASYSLVSLLSPSSTWLEIQVQCSVWADKIPLYPLHYTGNEACLPLRECLLRHGIQIKTNSRLGAPCTLGEHGHKIREESLTPEQGKNGSSYDTNAANGINSDTNPVKEE